MDFFKVHKFRKAHKPDPGKDDPPVPVPPPHQDHATVNNAADPDPENGSEDDDDDDFITNEVKRRLKELRRNSFMVLIPEEESCLEEEEEDDEANGGEGETSCTATRCHSQWRDVEAEGRKWWRGFDDVYDHYCQRMLFFDRLILQHLHHLTGCNTPLAPSPKTAKKLPSPFRCLSLKKIEEPDDETEHLQQMQHDPYQELEAAYVGQVCLTWEALHCQYTQLNQKILCQPESSTCYNHSAQQFQQFQVLLQRFIENEPFQEGLRVETFARARNLLPMLLQIPNGKGSDEKVSEELESDSMVLAPDFIKIMEDAILTFQLFLKMDKRKGSSVLSLFGNQNQNQIAIPLQLIQSSVEKKKMKVKEVFRKSKSGKKKSWPQAYEDVEVLFSLIDLKILGRVTRMMKVSKGQLIWCEEKMKKIELCEGKLRRDPSPVLYPCE